MRPGIKLAFYVWSSVVCFLGAIVWLAVSLGWVDARVLPFHGTPVPWLLTAVCLWASVSFAMDARRLGVESKSQR